MDRQTGMVQGLAQPWSDDSALLTLFPPLGSSRRLPQLLTQHLGPGSSSFCKQELMASSERIQFSWQRLWKCRKGEAKPPGCRGGQVNPVVSPWSDPGRESALTATRRSGTKSGAWPTPPHVGHPPRHEWKQDPGAETQLSHTTPQPTLCFSSLSIFH